LAERRARVVDLRFIGRLAAPSDDGIGAQQLLVEVLSLRGGYAEAESLCRRTIDEVEGAGRGGEATALMAMNTLGLVLHKARRNADAIPWVERSLAGTRRLAGDDHPFVATQTQNLATLLRGVGELERAETLYRDALAASRARWEPPHADIAYKLGNLGSLLGDTGRTDEALAMLDEADAMLVELLGPRSLQRAFNSWYRGGALVKASRLDQAVEAFELALDIRSELLPPAHPEIAGVHMDLGSTHFYRGDLAASARHYRAAREIWLALDGEPTGRVLSSSVALAVALAESGRGEVAVALADSTLCDVRAAYPERADLAALHGADLGWCEFRAGHTVEGRARIEAALPVIRATYGDAHANTRRQVERLAQIDGAARE
jgi:tetratricopeptide (TPR) repeat protein